jgi:hypothetical protein
VLMIRAAVQTASPLTSSPRISGSGHHFGHSVRYGGGAGDLPQGCTAAVTPLAAGRPAHGLDR